MLKATSEKTEGIELKTEVDEDIKEFDLWFQQQGKNDPLSMPERAIISTFCWWLVKARGAKKLDPVSTLPAPAEKPGPDTV